MKKKLIFPFVGTLAIALGVASCTSDDENHCPDQVESLNSTTRSVVEMTKEEVENGIKKNENYG